MSGIRRNLDLCRSQKYQVCPVSVIIAQENAAYRWAIGEEMRQRVTTKDGGVSSVAIEDILIHYHHSYPFRETTTINYLPLIPYMTRQQ